jgi:hypothetical protein
MTGTRKKGNAPTGRKDVSVSHREKLITELRGDPELTAAYLNAAAEDGDQCVYLAALRTLFPSQVEDDSAWDFLGQFKVKTRQTELLLDMHRNYNSLFYKNKDYK